MENILSQIILRMVLNPEKMSKKKNFLKVSKAVKIHTLKHYPISRSGIEISNLRGAAYMVSD